MTIKKRLSLKHLSCWLNALGRTEMPAPRRLLAEQSASILSLCEANGIVAFKGRASERTCRECADPHVAQIIFERGGYNYFCPMNGVVVLTEDDLKLVKFHKDALLRALTASAGLKESAPREFADGLLVYLGLIGQKGANRLWGLAYAEGLDDPNTLADVLENIRQRFPDGPGLIVTPSRIALTLPLPRQYKLVAFHELFFGEENRIVLDWEMAQVCLGRRVKVPGAPGRPTKREITRVLRAKLIKEGNWPAKVSTQIGVISTHWPRSEWPPPCNKTLEKQLAAISKGNG